MSNFTATKTLAELYEKQEMPMEAYIIYKKIYSENPAEEIKEKIEQLGKKIIDESLYSQITLKIFDREELATYSIFPERDYKKVVRIIYNMSTEETFNDILDSYQENAEVQGDIKNYSGEEIYEIIQSNFGGKKPEDIKLADIYEIIKEK